MTVSEVETPVNHWCSSGHEAAQEWRREGLDSPLQATKFYRITGHGVDQVFCEPCIVVARWLSQQKKGTP